MGKVNYDQVINKTKFEKQKGISWIVKAFEPRAASFNFFPAESDSFNILSQYHGFMKVTEKSDISKNLPQNFPFLLSVSSETVRK